MDTTSLIVRGDDFGLCHAANQAIWEGFETGVLTCASLVVPGPWIAEAAALVHDYPEWEVGLQLVLYCDGSGCRWGPVAGPAAVPSLVDATGAFVGRLAATAAANEINRELDAQFDRARAWGVTPAYVVYRGEPHPGVEEALHRLSERTGIPAGVAGWGLASVLDRHDGPRDDALGYLSGLAPGVHLWVTQPAQDSPETWALWADDAQTRRRHADALAICAPEILGQIRQRSIELIGFREHIEERLGGQAEKE
jgi:hypothetical protein